MGGDRLFRAQDQPHAPDSVHIGHLDVDNLCAKLAQSVHGGLNGSRLFRLNALSRKAPVKSNPQTTNAFLQFVQHMRHGISQRLIEMKKSMNLRIGRMLRAIPCFRNMDKVELR
jgi:hypothetical protein